MTPGGVDAAVVRRHLAELDDALRELREHQGKSIAALRDSTTKRWAVERGLQLCAQNALDIATHLAAAAGREPASYAGALDELVAMTVLPRKFGEEFRSVAGFRNAVVHGYLAIDIERVHQLLNQRLDDFVRFAQYVEEHLQHG